MGHGTSVHKKNNTGSHSVTKIYQNRPKCLLLIHQAWVLYIYIYIYVIHFILYIQLSMRTLDLYVTVAVAHNITSVLDLPF